MRAVLKLEMWGSGNARHQSYMGGNTSKPWVARICGFDDKFEFAREFQHGKRDYTNASSTGARGIFAYYFLEPGIYEVNERVSWKHVDRHFIRVSDDAKMERISYDEVLLCLRNMALESPSWTPRVSELHGSLTRSRESMSASAGAKTPRLCFIWSWMRRSVACARSVYSLLISKVSTN